MTTTIEDEVTAPQPRLAGGKPRGPWRRPVAEGVLIVVSILLALAAEALWSYRMDRAEERQLLSALRDELSLNQSVLRNNIDTLAASSAALRRLLSSSPADLRAVGADSIYDLVVRPLQRAYTVELAVGTLGSALGSGKLDLIRSPLIRSALAQYEAKRGDVAEVGAVVSGLSVEATLALGRVPGLASLIGSRPLPQDSPDGERLRIGPPAVVQIPESWVVAFADQPDIPSLIAAKINFWSGYVYELRLLINQIHELLQMIDAELGAPVGADSRPS